MSEHDRPEAADQPVENEPLQEVPQRPEAIEVTKADDSGQEAASNPEAVLGAFPPRLPTPSYGTPFPVEFSLYNGPATLNGTALKNGAVVTLISDARDTIEAAFELPIPTALALSEAGQPVSFEAHGYSLASALIENVTMTGVAGAHAVARVRAQLTDLRQQDVTTTEIEFVGFNLPEWRGEYVRSESQKSPARLTLDAGDFDIILEHHPQRPKKEVLKQAGGGLTTVGRLHRKDGKEFRTDDPEAERALEALTWTFVFATANWITVPALLTATSTTGGAWQHTHLTKSTGFRNHQNWFLLQPVAAVQAVYKGVLAKLKDPLWEMPVREAISWYADAHGDGGTEVGHLIWAQTGLELLGWMQLTQGPSPAQTETAYDNARAAQKIRDLLKVFNIDPAIPTAYADLQTFANNLRGPGGVGVHDPLDGPSILTHVRNSFVHPSKRQKHTLMAPNTDLEATRLALEYIELCLLGIFGVNAPVWRRSRTAMQTPPWVPAPAPVTAPGAATTSATTGSGGPVNPSTT